MIMADFDDLHSIANAYAGLFSLGVDDAPSGAGAIVGCRLARLV
jgi:hypothetical protein